MKTELLICPLCLGQGAVFFSAEPSPRGERDYFLCPYCDLMFLRPEQRLSIFDEEEEYQLHNNSNDDKGYCQHLERLLSPLREYLPTEGEPLGLDFGSGPSPVLATLMSRSGYSMKHFDPIYNNDPSLLHGVYDFITCTEVVEHFRDPHEQFNQLHRMVAEGGCLAVMTGMLEDWDRFSTWHYRRELTHICFYSMRSMQWIAKRWSWSLIPIDKNIVFLGKTAAAISQLPNKTQST